jgi:hypothetical protein
MFQLGAVEGSRTYITILIFDHPPGLESHAIKGLPEVLMSLGCFFWLYLLVVYGLGRFLVVAAILLDPSIH